jgi:hypothetical protein
MTLYSITVLGRIRNGKLEVELPPDAREGQVEVQISALSTDEAWTADELHTLLESEPSTLGEILDAGLVGIGAEAMTGQPDSVEFIRQQRERRRM